MSIKRCELCKHGIASAGPDGGRFVVCALAPPVPRAVQTVVEGQIRTSFSWLRPSMMLTGWCGQHSLSLWKLLGGSRT